MLGLAPVAPRVGVDGGGDGALVERVAPNSPAARAGLVPGDTLLGIDGRPTPTPNDVRRALSRVIAGERVLLLVRDAAGAERETSIEAAPKPLEAPEGCASIYDAIDHRGARLRRILTVPREGAPRAWILYVQGHGDASVDGGGHPTRPLPTLAASLARRGFGFVRVDRPGAGDSEGPPLRTLSLVDEVAVYATALHALRARVAAERTPIVLFAHSLGGAVASRLGVDDATRPDAAIVYGGGAKTWTEYFDENCRRQWTLAGVPHVQQDKALRAIQRFHALAITLRRSLDDVRAEMPEIDRDPTLFGLGDDDTMRGRPLAYWRDVCDAPVASELAAAKLPVLAAWGTSDWLASRDDHELVAACVNEGGDGLGEFREIVGADHFLAERASQRESFVATDAGTLSRALVEAVGGWMENLLR